MLTPWRRHLKTCRRRNQGRNCAKCSCPIWADGILNGHRYRRSLKTRDWGRALRKLAELEGMPQLEAPKRKPIAEAVQSFQKAKQDVSAGTQRNYKRVLRIFEDFTAARGLQFIDEVDLENLTAFRATREIGTLTWVKELEILRGFFRYCLNAEWVRRNCASLMPTPRNLKPAPREPYEPNEIIKMIAACDVIGLYPYERLRARAMVLLLRYTGLRISDVALLARDRVAGGEIFVRTTKNGKVVRLPLHPDLKAALEALPLPRGADGPGCPYYFWSGHGSQRAMIRDATRTLAAVFRSSGVPHACSHRFRHTLATEILALGGTFEDAADILGDSPAIVQKHYAKWSTQRQARISGILARLWHTEKSRLQDVDSTGGFLVDGMGFEPTTPALRTPCSP
ncbi:MAG: tyrosine-type recombinase/integrase, partial [Bryobacteraceae bacterium]